MFGPFQHSRLRIEVDAPAALIRNSLTQPTLLQQWLWPQRLSKGLPESLHAGLTFMSWIGPVAIEHHVDQLNSNSMRFVLSQGIDGFHEWHWGEGWLQSRLEGASILPLNLAQTLALVRLRQFLMQHPQTASEGRSPFTSV